MVFDLSREVAIEGGDISADGAQAGSVELARRAFFEDTSHNVKQCPKVEDSMSVQTNEIRERDGLAQDIGVRDRGACNVRRGSRDVSERGEGLDVSNVAGHTNAVGCFSGGVAVEGELSRSIGR